jgi:hypothetical protein
MAAAVHHSRHGRHRRSQQELVLVHGDSHYCAELALVLPRAMCRDYTLGFARHLRPRRDDTHGRTDVRFIILRRAWQGALREVFWPTRKPKTWSAWTRSPPARGGRQTSFPHIGSNWLPHSLRRGTEALAPAAATFETIRRTFVKITVHVVELMVVIKLPSGRHACGDDGRDHDAGPMIDAARAASPHFNHKTRSDCRGGALFRPLSTTYDDG